MGNTWILLALLPLALAHQGLRSYEARPTDVGAAALLQGDETSWRAAHEIRWGPTPYETRFRALTTDAALWLRWDADDAAPWHTLTERDDPIWREEVVEIFLDPDGDGRDYVEVEISPAGVVTDLLVRRATPDLDADLGWDVENLRSRVLSRAGGWSAIVALPWASLAGVPGATGVRPASGEAWRFNVFRIKRPHGPERPDEDLILAAWAPVPGRSFHVPEVFGWMRFVE